MSTTADQQPLTFSELVGSNSRSRLLEYLATADGASRQFEIAEELDLSQASVSRAAQSLIDAGVLSRGEHSELILDDDVKIAINTVQTLMGTDE